MATLQSERQAALLKELNEIRKSNPLALYNFESPLLPPVHKKQLQFHAIETPPLGIKALIAANRSGKTYCVAADDVIQLIPDELVPLHLAEYKKWHQPIQIWVGAPKLSNHESTLIPLFRKLIPKAALLEGSFAKSFRRQPTPIITLANGSTVTFKTYEMDLDAWASAEVHRIHWDEEPNGENGRALRSEARARLVSTDGEEVIGMTPLLGFSWVHDDVWLVRDTDPLVSVVQMEMEDNPFNSAEAIAKYAEGLTDEEKRMRLKGEFVHLGGLFFEEFDRNRHVTKAITPDHLKGQEIVVIIDPGSERSGVAWMAFDKENRGLVFDQYFPHKVTVPTIAAEIKDRNKAWGLKQEPDYVIDPSARNENVINADKVEAAFQREGIYPEWGQNNRAAGILEIKRRLQARPPRLLFAENCPDAIEQAERYARDPKALDEWKAVPQTKRVRHDLIDGVRYGVMSRTEWDPDENPAPARTAYQPNFQPPYREELFPESAPPMGAFS
jgi:phage terminase large subunit-like protein